MAPTVIKPKVLKLLHAASSGNLALFKKLAKQLDNGKGLATTVANAKDINKRGALHFAATEDRIELCKYLLEVLKVDVNAKDVEGETPVHHAAQQGHTAIVQYLIEQGADPAAASSMGATALHFATAIGAIEVVKLLLSKGVDVDAQSDDGTPLLLAAGLAQEEAVKVLLEHHANPNARTVDDMCPLTTAIAATSLRCVELLIEAGADVNIRAIEATPLLIASHRGSAEIINCLLQAGADPNAADWDGNKPIHVAATRGSRAAVGALLPVTPRIQSVPEWSVDGIIEFMQPGTRRGQETTTEAGRKDLPQVTPESKKKAADAKAMGAEAFKRKDYAMAKDAYTQAIIFDPTDATLFSNRSLCWVHLGQAEHALSDAKLCRERKPDWAKACYREGAALRLLQRFEEAATAFHEGIQIDPESKELADAFREAVEAGREFHIANKIIL